MKPISPVMQGSENIEIILGENQPAYLPLPAVYIDSNCRPMVTRWEFSDEERESIASGANLVIQQLTFKRKFQPINLQVVRPGHDPVLLEDPEE